MTDVEDVRKLVDRINNLLPVHIAVHFDCQQIESICVTNNGV